MAREFIGREDEIGVRFYGSWPSLKTQYSGGYMTVEFVRAADLVLRTGRFLILGDEV